MAQRTKIGIHYVYNENWIGGTYYIENLISALNHLDEKRKPELYIFTGKSEDYLRLTGHVRYPYMHHASYIRSLNIGQRIINKLSRTALSKNIFSSLHDDLAVVFPAENETKFPRHQQFLYWIPDFQEHYLPQFFSTEEIENRKSYQKKLVDAAKFIVFSSEAAKKDFNEIYPANKVEQFVLRFAVTTPPLENAVAMRKKYDLPERYFLCSNQFWTHKNHTVVLEALKILSDDKSDAFIAFTGKEADRRNPEYFNDLKRLVGRLQLGPRVKFLGFIDREDQLSLMHGAVAVVQPSLFEGWSTVIEDAKSMGQYVIASNLSVHREQLTANAIFFDPKNAAQLAGCMRNLLSGDINKTSLDYTQNVQRFANDFMDIVDTTSRKR